MQSAILAIALLGQVSESDVIYNPHRLTEYDWNATRRTTDHLYDVYFCFYPANRYKRDAGTFWVIERIYSSDTEWSDSALTGDYVWFGDGLDQDKLLIRLKIFRHYINNDGDWTLRKSFKPYAADIEAPLEERSIPEKSITFVVTDVTNIGDDGYEEDRRGVFEMLRGEEDYVAQRIVREGGVFEANRVALEVASNVWEDNMLSDLPPGFKPHNPITRSDVTEFKVEEAERKAQEAEERWEVSWKNSQMAIKFDGQGSVLVVWEENGVHESASGTYNMRTATAQIAEVHFKQLTFVGVDKKQHTRDLEGIVIDVIGTVGDNTLSVAWTHSVSTKNRNFKKLGNWKEGDSWTFSRTWEEIR